MHKRKSRRKVSAPVQCSMFNLCEIRGKIELHCFVSSWAFPGILESRFSCSIAVSLFTLILRRGALSITMSFALKGNLEVIRILLKLKREWGKFEMRHGGWRRQDIYCSRRWQIKIPKDFRMRNFWKFFLLPCFLFEPLSSSHFIPRCIF